MRYDLAIIGGGFGGSILAQVACRLGLSVLLLERGSHPRFAIGESTSPLTNLLIETLSERYDLPRLAPLATWGAWKREYPDIRTGLKRGFTYFGQEAGRPAHIGPEGSGRLLVAASPADPCADTHWFRADVDHFLQREAVSAGAEYHDRTEVTAISEDGGGWKVACLGLAGPWSAEARMVVDAGGAPGPVARAMGIAAGTFPDFPTTRALYSHWRGVRPSTEVEGLMQAGPLPYPPDWSALHHVFDGGWMWVLRFDDDVASAGFAAKAWLADALDLSDAEGAWRRFLERFPTICAQFEGAEPIEALVSAPRIAFRMDRAAGTGSNGAPWCLLPSAAGFVDPLYSTGFSLTLAGIDRLGRLLEAGLPSAMDLRGWESATLRDLDWTAEFIAGNYAAFSRFDRFVDTAQFYFAAAAFTESARRLGAGHLAPGVLLSGRPDFQDAFRRWRAAPDAPVSEAIAPWNVAGLADPGKRNLYGVDLADLVDGAEKLGLERDAVRSILATAEWARCA